MVGPEFAIDAWQGGLRWRSVLLQGNLAIYRSDVSIKNTTRYVGGWWCILSYFKTCQGQQLMNPYARLVVGPDGGLRDASRS